MIGFLAGPDSADLLKSELRLYSLDSECPAPGVFCVNKSERLPQTLAFAAQTLPNCFLQSASSISQWSNLIFEQALKLDPAPHSWVLHIFDLLSVVNGKQSQRARLIESGVIELLRRKRRSLHKVLHHAFGQSVPKNTADFLRQFHLPTPSEAPALLQLILLTPDTGLLSCLSSEEHSKFTQLVSPFRAGFVPVPDDKSVPSRAYRKLLEGQAIFGQWIEPAQKCVDLGACPGGWSAIALKQGAFVTAVDRSPLRDDLMRNKQLTFHKGDAFSFEPKEKVDWLICDVIAFPERSFELVQKWHAKGWCKRCLVTLKFKGQPDLALLEAAKKFLAQSCKSWGLRHLRSNKNEVMLFGDF